MKACLQYLRSDAGNTSSGFSRLAGIHRAVHRRIQRTLREVSAGKVSGGSETPNHRIRRYKSSCAWRVGGRRRARWSPYPSLSAGFLDRAWRSVWAGGHALFIPSSAASDAKARTEIGSRAGRGCRRTPVRPQYSSLRDPAPGCTLRGESWRRKHRAWFLDNGDFRARVVISARPRCLLRESARGSCWTGFIRGPGSAVDGGSSDRAWRVVDLHCD